MMQNQEPPPKDYFKIARDFVFEIGLTPNRIDSGSHFGVARDLAAYLNLNTSFIRKALFLHYQDSNLTITTILMK